MAAVELSQTLVDQWSDPRWRLNNLYHITNEQGRRLRFRLNWAQETLFQDRHYLNVILKARQLGFTTFIQLYMLDQCMFNSNVRAGVVAHNREDAAAFFRDKVKFPYDNLDEALRQINPAMQDSTNQLSFKNNSSIRVGTSLRSGTLQILHVSEYGKVCAKFPEKAKEIKTGAFNTVHAGQEIYVESTAEGQEGHFYEMTDEAQTLQRRGAVLTPLDFKFHFFPWWRHPGYVLNASDVPIPKEMGDYFQRLLTQYGIELTAEQKAWYVRKAAQQGPEMKREFPSTPEEAFEAAIEGAYYAEQMAHVDLSGRVRDIPPEKGLRVHTWWDLGMNDVMSIGFIQIVNGWYHMIDYYQNSGYGLGHYAEVLQEKQRVGKWIYGEHVWPHDGNVRILDEKGRKRTEVMRDLGYQVRVVARTGDVNDGIELTRNMLPKVVFDRASCGPLVKALKSYRKEWDEKTSTYRDKPLHNWASHPADMMRTGAQHQPISAKFQEPIDYGAGREYV